MSLNETVRRIFVEKKKGYDIFADNLYRDLKENLRIDGLKDVRVLNRYDIEGISDQEYSVARESIFSEPPVDTVYDETFETAPGERKFAVEYLPGQYDQRADSASQCIQLLTHGNRPAINTAQVIVLSGKLSDQQFKTIKSYCINPVDSREALLDKPASLKTCAETPPDVQTVSGFISMDDEKLSELRTDLGLAMKDEDVKFCQQYFRDTEKRDPTITEVRMLDTYWSDHCRHTTFLTRIDEMHIEQGKFNQPLSSALEAYKSSRTYMYGQKNKDICLMDIATIGMKELRKRGVLDNLDASEEINACSISVPVEIDGRTEEWLVMFKNETHNHPTEIEPFGGAATCLGGAIRDPLSGRSYVYQAMRVTGSADPRTAVEETLPGKLPQRKITTLSAHGYSSYGNQIGLATGLVSEVYHEGYMAKRMEIGAVVGAAPKENVVREVPEPGDIVVLLGGRTGRDGCGGATGSSKEHTEESIESCSAEVQKGNPPTERKIQRLFRNPQVSKMIRRCNDFGAGGVSVAIGELAPGLTIDLDAVPKKYDGLDGTELAISESQERMAVVIDPANLKKLVSFADAENLECAVVASVTEEKRLRMQWRGKRIVDLSRDFIDTNGVLQSTKVKVTAPEETSFFGKTITQKPTDLTDAWFDTLKDLNVCSQRGLIEMFDSSIGASTVLMPFGGKYQATPTQCMVAKLPLLEGETTTGTAMSYGFNPHLSTWSPFHGAVYAVVDAVAKLVVSGADYKRARLTLQEYFEKLGNDESKWGKPFAALLGAYLAQIKLGTAAIGGKDSMSGTFRDMHVPPTLVAFAIAPVDVSKTISPEFKKAGSKIVLLSSPRDNEEMPDFDKLKTHFSKVTELIHSGDVISAHTVGAGGVAESVAKMCFGNRIGATFQGSFTTETLFLPEYGSMVLEVNQGADIDTLFNNCSYSVLGQTTEEKTIRGENFEIQIDKLYSEWERPLDSVFPSDVISSQCNETVTPVSQTKHSTLRPTTKIAKPRVLVTVFPGTNCEYDTVRAFEKAGGECELFILKNCKSEDVDKSIDEMVKKISSAQIIMIPGGFSAGDEPDGSGKFITSFFRNPHIKDSVTELLEKRDGLMLGICNGFQALIKLGLVPWGKICDIDQNSPTLTFNTIGRHISRMAYTKICSVNSPWLSKVSVGDVHAVPISHGEGRFIASSEQIDTLAQNGQIITTYVNCLGEYEAGMNGNCNGSCSAIEGISSPDGRVLGKMGHSERKGEWVGKNIYGNKDQLLFESGIEYFG
ncbi:phosphoribosylformylglycinamidine synthase [Chitinispirillales bacterium ANBcel5]|uniref:phosphoribosylformylglycinamidine synthase n=1 Tax=Cellulosispirillum alkaliphilum TaxID=3039283 RepID=UPI002A4EF077|nr:phosphoribosylformylglycinamidine synthase [Chitinispirillales bacterium ANBcel5]